MAMNGRDSPARRRRATDDPGRVAARGGGGACGAWRQRGGSILCFVGLALLTLALIYQGSLGGLESSSALPEWPRDDPDPPGAPPPGDVAGGQALPEESEAPGAPLAAQRAAEERAALEPTGLRARAEAQPAQPLPPHAAPASMPVPAPPPAPAPTPAVERPSPQDAVTGDETRQAVAAMAAWRARHRRVLKSASAGGRGCARCCHDGERWGAPCFDVDACASRAAMGGRYAFVYAHVGRPGWPWLTFIPGMRLQALALAAETNSTVDIVVIMPKKDADSLGPRHLELVRQYDIRVVSVPWVIPPALKWWPKGWWPGKADGWCGPQDLVRLHVLGMTEYSAAVFYDQDVEFHGDAGAVLKCASTGRLLSASGGVGEPLNVGFFAVRPDARLLRAAEIFAEDVKFSEQTGWADSGFRPAGGYFVGAECGQGYMHTLFYQKRSKKAQDALQAAGLVGDAQVRAESVDRCIWNYQTGHECPANFDCELIRVHHKPTGKPNGGDCAKLARRPKSMEPSPFAAITSPGRKSLAAWATLPCSAQFVNIGANCKCNGENYIKTVTAAGDVLACEGEAMNGAGDRFTVSFDGRNVTATRADARSCWCDDALEAHCCVATGDAKPKKAAVKGAVEAAAPPRKIPALPAPAPAAAATPSSEKPWRFQPQDVQTNIAGWAARQPPPQQCPDCCHDGYRWGVSCYDVHPCAANAKPGGKYAFVLAQIGKPGWPFLTFLDGMKQQAKALEAKSGGTVEIVLLIPPEDAQNMPAKTRAHLKQYEVRLFEVAWTLPPTLKWWPSDWWPGKGPGWCGPQDLVRLHVLGMTEYDAAAFYDQDVEFQGDVTDALLCASTGKFISASGGVGEPLNVGFFAVRPDDRFLKAAIQFAEGITFNRETGWGQAGFLPSGGYFIGAECGQGYIHSLMHHTKSARVKEAWDSVGLPFPEAHVVDRCIWNYQTGNGCPARFDCSRILAHHKPTSKPEGRDCGKLRFAAKDLPSLSSPVVPDGPELRRPCSVQDVKVGKNCFCNQPSSSVKRISVPGFIIACQPWVKNPSGDAFSLVWSSSAAGSNLTTTREDADACWCDDVFAKCCVVPLDAL